MKIQVKSWITGGVLFAIDADSWNLAVEAAVKSGAYLRGADLRGAALSGADLSGADLRGADRWDSVQSEYVAVTDEWVRKRGAIR